MHQIPVDHIEADECPAVANMHVIIHSRTTDIHTNPAFYDRGKILLLAAVAVIDLQAHARKNKLLIGRA